MGDKKNNLQHEIEDLVFGSIAGMVGKVVEYPFDTVKVRLQIQPTHQPHYTGALDCITRTLRHEGVKGLFKVVMSHVWRHHGLLGFYRGFWATMVRETFGGMFWFGAYEYACAAFLDRKQRRYPDHRNALTKKDLSSIELMVSGAMGGIGYNVSMFPVDVIKSISQTDEEVRKGLPPRSISQVAKSIYQDAGIKGFYRGCGITALRSAPTSAIIFLTYEQLTQHVRIPL
ncbi:hypothetical protein [Absidia glauca]|uniref:Mitochondrial carrier protein n=1 Tax=Absidia glauca TaxID=4829 RepID=A0A170AN07_ABSGL|nr:hypothetical protein [Absidia glauca]